MIDTAIWISVLVFSGMMLLYSGGYYYLRMRDNKRRVLEKIKGEGKLRTDVGHHVSSSGTANEGVLKQQIMQAVSPLGNIFVPKSEEELSGIRKKLLRAGYRTRNAPFVYFGVKTLLAFVLPVVLLILKVFAIKAMSSTAMMLIAITAALIGFYIPDIWLKAVTQSRKEKILEGFPDALDLMTVCVEAGMGMDAAIYRAGKEIEMSNKVVGKEFHYLSLELRAGKTRRDALRNLADRVGLEEINNLVSLLIQTDRFGTSIAQALRVHADAMRDKRYQRAEEIAAKLPVKLMFPLVVFIFPTLFIVLAGPAAIRIYRSLLPAMTGS